ncbi:putative P450 monooxygenase [Hortaea werneckii]|nr:putative P450 monooxygenase [Hortaea werneckii]
MEPLGFSKSLGLIGTFAALSLLFLIGQIIYRVYFHPLSRIPGPKINAVSRIPYIRHLLAGTTVENVSKLHAKYGDVVRVSPSQVSFINGETSFPEIYGFRTGKLKGHANMLKDPVWYPPPVNGAPSIIIANDTDHSRARKTLSHAFSEKALAEQEGLLHRYSDQLVSRLKEVTSESPEPVNMVKWYNWFTFDIIADLLFGEPFGCLQDLRTHPYIDLLFRGVKSIRFFYIMKFFPAVKYLGSLVVDKAMLASRQEYQDWITSQATKRRERDVERPDFMGMILKHNGEKGQSLSNLEIDSNCSIFITAGSETTATLLSGCTYLMLQNPEVYQKVKDEVRGAFAKYDDITLEAINRGTPYLLATLQEALRYYPPVPTGFERQVPSGGEVVSGYYLPEGTAVSVSHYPAYHSESNFKNAESFVPERWMGDPMYANDKRSGHQPFSFGPRNCLGKNLAYAEMRLLMAKVVWSFDFELDARSENWFQRNKVFTLWEKPELLVHLKEVLRD